MTTLDEMGQLRVSLLRDRMKKILEFDIHFMDTVVFRPAEFVAINSMLNSLKEEDFRLSNTTDSKVVSVRLDLDTMLHNIRKKYENYLDIVFKRRNSTTESLRREFNIRLSNQVEKVHEASDLKILNLKTDYAARLEDIRKVGMGNISSVRSEVSRLKMEISEKRILLKSRLSSYRVALGENKKLTAPVQQLRSWIATAECEVKNLMSECFLEKEQKRYASLRAKIRQADLHLEILIQKFSTDPSTTSSEC